VATETRPAFYALSPGGWRDYVTLLHPPYTAWHLSYVVIGAALAPVLIASRLVPTLVAFFLAVGIAAHALDELHGHPLRTRISDPTLMTLAAVSLAGATAIGIYGVVEIDPWIAAFIVVGLVGVVGYNAELFGLHGDWQFALLWGGFPVLTGYFACAETLDEVAIAAAAFATLLSLAQRRLSTQVRDVRRRVDRVSGTVERNDGTTEPVTVETLIGAEERALRLLAASTVLLAAALVIMRAA
jgi:hypothetical protein